MEILEREESIGNDPAHPREDSFLSFHGVKSHVDIPSLGHSQDKRKVLYFGLKINWK